MKNKVLVQLVVPDVEKTFDIYLPINKRIGNIINLLNQAVAEITKGTYQGTSKTGLYNSSTGEKYQVNDLLRTTTIRNGTRLILL